METLPESQNRATAVERDRTIGRLQEAYIHGQLTERELGERIDRALGAVVVVDLSNLVSDLPAIVPPPQPTAVKVPWWRRRKTDSVYKATVRKNGAWSVPAFYSTHVYKGTLILDLRRAVLSGPDTQIQLNAYKSHVLVIVPEEYTVLLEGTSYKGSAENLTQGGSPGAPRVVVDAKGYKSSVLVTHHDPNEARAGF